MRRQSFQTSVLLFAAFFIAFQGCKSDKDEEPDPAEQQFVATDATFQDYMQWALEATHQGADPALGGAAHGGNDSTVTRNVYFKDGQDPEGGVYPKGTVIVKRSTNPSNTVNETTALVKRGAGFNPDDNGWEWFMLNPDGTIAQDQNGNSLRGADLMNGMCSGCHVAASQQDFVFSK